MPRPDPDDQPAPVATAVVAGLLRLIAAGLEPVDVEPYGPRRTISVVTTTGWCLDLRIDVDGAPAAILYAQPPSLLVLPWIYGGHRDDWTLGPDSKVITPVALLTTEQRLALQQRLEGAPVRWQFAPLPVWDVSNLEEELILD